MFWMFFGLPYITLRCTNRLMASFLNDDYYKVVFADACFREAIVFLINPYYQDTRSCIVRPSLGVQDTVLFTQTNF